MNLYILYVFESGCGVQMLPRLSEYCLHKGEVITIAILYSVLHIFRSPYLEVLRLLWLSDLEGENICPFTTRVFFVVPLDYQFHNNLLQFIEAGRSSVFSDCQGIDQASFLRRYGLLYMMRARVATDSMW